jgi:hypothetical protein
MIERFVSSCDPADMKRWDQAINLFQTLVRDCEGKPLTVVINAIVFLFMRILLEEIEQEQRQSLIDLVISKLTDLPTLVQQFERDEAQTETLN